MPDWPFYWHSGIHESPLSRYMLHYQSCAVCPCPCCLSMSIMHVHVHVACPCQCCMSMSMSMYIYIEIPECRTVRHPVSPVPDWKKLLMSEQVRYRTKLTQSGIFLVRYRTKIRDAGMRMPAIVSSMLMPSYATKWVYSTCLRRTYLHCDMSTNTKKLPQAIVFCQQRMWKVVDFCCCFITKNLKICSFLCACKYPI